MRKLFLSVVIILITSHLLSAQICDTVNCNAIKDYVTAKITQAFLIDFIKPITKTSKIDSLNYKKIEPFFNTNKIETPLKYSELANCLNKNNFTTTNQKLASLINSSDINLSQITNSENIATIIIDQLLSKLDAGQIYKINNLGTFKNDLIKELNSYISNKLNKSNTNLLNTKGITNDQSNEKNKLVNESNTTNSFFSNFNFYNLIGLILPVIFFIIIIFKDINYRKEQNIKIKDLHDKIDFELNKRENNGGGRHNNNTINSQTKSITKEEFDILLGRSVAFEAFQDQFEKLRRDIVDINQKKENLSQVPKIENNITEQNINPDIFYMTKPVENYFPVQAKSTNPSETVYKFTIGHNKLTAEYVIHTLGAPISEIIKRSETYLVPGCTEENSTFSSAKKIETKRPGKVQLEGDKWVILEKAIIRYV